MPYNPALDGLRALAITLVLLLHAGAPVMQAGYVGVDLFFVLSGYLITRILVSEHARTGTISLPGFYLRRALRLYPAMLLFLAAYWAIAPLVWPSYPHGRDAFGVAFYLMDYAIPFADWGKYLGHTWSLGVEEKFYLLWPALLLFCLRRYSVRNIAHALLIAAVVSFLWMLLNLGALLPTYTRFDTRLTGIILGCWFALQAVRPMPWPGAGNSKVLGIGGAAVLAVALATGHRLGPSVMYLTIPLAEIAAVGLIAGASSLPLSHPWLAWLGRMSYGIYLWHYPVMAALRGSLAWWQTLAIGGAVAALAAALSYYTIESMVRSGKRQWIRRGSAATNTDSTYVAAAVET